MLNEILTAELAEEFYGAIIKFNNNGDLVVNSEATETCRQDRQKKDKEMSDECNFLMKIIKERRSIRRYTSKPINEEQIKTIIEAARWAPSGGNTQPWEFIVIKKKEVIDIIRTLMTGVWGNMKEGPVFICICVNKERGTAWTPFDIGCALQNMLLCAHSLGLGSCAIGGFDTSTFSKVLNLPDHLDPCLFVTLGYPEKKAVTPTRKSLDELVYREI